MENAVWITGASSGIGREIALHFAREGKVVIASARRFKELQSMAESEKFEKGRIIPLELDVSDSESITTAYNKIRENYFIECLVNNAGVSSFKNAMENSDEEIKNIIETNLTGTILVTRKVIPAMTEAKSGRIMNILSVTSKKIFTNSSVYSASKTGLEAYMNVLREELREYNIRITNFYPGATKTPIWPNGALEKFASRMMNPRDVAKVIFEVFNQKENIVSEEVVLRPLKGDL